MTGSKRSHATLPINAIKNTKMRTWPCLLPQTWWWGWLEVLVVLPANLPVKSVEEMAGEESRGIMVHESDFLGIIMGI